MKKIILSAGVIFILLLAYSCSKSDNSSNNSIIIPVTNLVKNGSFETNGEPSLSNWTEPDTIAKFAEDTPQGGLKWCIYMDSQAVPPRFIKTAVSPGTGDKLYKFSFWAKTRYKTGFANFYLKRPDTLILLNTVPVVDSVWTQYMATDSIKTTASDSLVIGLSGGLSELFAGRTWFDLIRLEVVK